MLESVEKRKPSRGRLLVISGPSGAGKTSICNGLLAAIPGARWSGSVTTRPRRGHEVDGREYQFVAPERFHEMLARDELLEHAQYLGNWYGTPRGPVDDALNAGAVMIMEIDVQGGAQVARRVAESIRVFILPPTMETLKARLEGRQTESEAIQRKRLAEADGEIAFARTGGVYQHFITNDILQDSIDRILRIVRGEMAKG